MTTGHDPIESQQQSSDTNNSETILNSSIDDQGISNRTVNGFCTSSRELLMNTSSSTQYTGSTQTPDDEYKANSYERCDVFEKLPGIMPVSGHQCVADWI